MFSLICAWRNVWATIETSVIWDTITLIISNVNQTCICIYMYFCYYIEIVMQSQRDNSLAPGRSEWNFRSLIFQLILVIDGWSISYDIAFRWWPLYLIDDVSIDSGYGLATSHYLSLALCWPRSTLPYSVTRPLCVNLPTLMILFKVLG